MDSRVTDALLVLRTCSLEGLRTCLKRLEEEKEREERKRARGNGVASVGGAVAVRGEDGGGDGGGEGNSGAAAAAAVSALLDVRGSTNATASLTPTPSLSPALAALPHFEMPPPSSLRGRRAVMAALDLLQQHVGVYALNTACLNGSTSTAAATAIITATATTLTSPSSLEQRGEDVAASVMERVVEGLQSQSPHRDTYLLLGAWLLCLSPVCVRGECAATTTTAASVTIGTARSADENPSHSTSSANAHTTPTTNAYVNALAHIITVHPSRALRLGGVRLVRFLVADETRALVIPSHHTTTTGHTTATTNTIAATTTTSDSIPFSSFITAALRLSRACAVLACQSVGRTQTRLDGEASDAVIETVAALQRVFGSERTGGADLGPLPHAHLTQTLHMHLATLQEWHQHEHPLYATALSWLRNSLLSEPSLTPPSSLSSSLDSTAPASVPSASHNNHTSRLFHNILLPSLLAHLHCVPAGIEIVRADVKDALITTGNEMNALTVCLALGRCRLQNSITSTTSPTAPSVPSSAHISYVSAHDYLAEAHPDCDALIRLSLQIVPHSPPCFSLLLPVFTSFPWLRVRDIVTSLLNVIASTEPKLPPPHQPQPLLVVVAAWMGSALLLQAQPQQHAVILALTSQCEEAVKGEGASGEGRKTTKQDVCMSVMTLLDMWWTSAYPTTPASSLHPLMPIVAEVYAYWLSRCPDLFQQRHAPPSSPSSLSSPPVPLSRLQLNPQVFSTLCPPSLYLPRIIPCLVDPSFAVQKSARETILSALTMYPRIQDVLDTLAEFVPLGGVFAPPSSPYDVYQLTDPAYLAKGGGPAKSSGEVKAEGHNKDALEEALESVLAEWANASSSSSTSSTSSSTTSSSTSSASSTSTTSTTSTTSSTTSSSTTTTSSTATTTHSSAATFIPVLTERWTATAAWVVERMLSRPGHSLTVKLVARLAVCWVNEQCAGTIFSAVLLALGEKCREEGCGEGEESVKLEDGEEAASGGGALGQLLVMQRLAPLLLLRCLPQACFEALFLSRINDKLAIFLSHGSCGAAEPEALSLHLLSCLDIVVRDAGLPMNLRRLAAELRSRFPLPLLLHVLLQRIEKVVDGLVPPPLSTPSAAATLSTASSTSAFTSITTPIVSPPTSSQREDDLAFAKFDVFSLCNACVLQWTTIAHLSNPSLVGGVTLPPQVVTLAVAAFSSSSSSSLSAPSLEHRKLVQGLVDFLGLAMLLSNTILSLSLAALTCHLDAADGHIASLLLGALAASIRQSLAVGISGMGGGGGGGEGGGLNGGGTSGSHASTESVSAAAQLAKQVMQQARPLLLRCIAIDIVSSSSTTSARKISAAALHVVFTALQVLKPFSFTGFSESDGPVLVSRCLSALQHPDPILQRAGLQLLGALLAVDALAATVVPALRPAFIAASSLSSSHPDEEVRSLATMLSMALRDVV